MDRTAVEEEYVEYVTARADGLRRLAFALTGDPDLADALVQSTVTDLYVHWRRARSAPDLDADVRSALVRSWVRGRRRVVGRASADSVRAAMQRLPRRVQAVLVLRFGLGMSVDATAATLRCTDRAVRRRAARGLEALRAHLGDPPPA
ncbi:RNA polymerase sigma24 factor [Virgisporangium aliadipatigenens]|uniref:RNA polymerase sigma24 factor n=1 Tax=Virgisporangium aliadipatigenens TaxID=741659 RepID=A0A8J3YET4_9ACTN|nr:sigma factor-like helix-turn-helix DNA-binding protein [Virgisporangium aliadipatigenens]GIJ43829.1 RNA polymerase sigma24 factor [Virgisporangium aliadipatigenens]